MFGAIVMILLMVVLLVFTRLTTTASQHFVRPVIVLMWGALTLTLAAAVLLFTSVFFGWPLELRERSAAPAPEVIPDPNAARIVQAQLDSRDYAGAWVAVQKALEAQPSATALRNLRVDVAQAWVRNARHGANETFAQIVAPLLPILYEAAASEDVRRAADAKAHIGWANFLQYREGQRSLDVESHYRDALALDPGNPFAHAMLGHWSIVSRNDTADAVAHFDAALRSDREHEFVRQLQLAALQWNDSAENRLALVRVADSMRKAGEPRPEAPQSFLSKAYSAEEQWLAQLARALPPGDNLETFRWLAGDAQLVSTLKFVHARLSELAGKCDAARRWYGDLLEHGWEVARAQQGLERCRDR